MIRAMVVVFAAMVLCVGFLGAQEKKDGATSIDPAKLKALLPEKLLGYARRSVNTQQMSMGDTAISTADTTYDKENDESENPPSVDVTYADYGSNSAMGQAAAAWANMNFSRESDGEYEKTTKVQGFPALERYDREGKSGTMTVFVASRFIVTLNVSNLSAEKMKEAVEALPLKKIAELK